MAELVRLQKFFTDCGIMSRRTAEKEIESGHVHVNGHIANLGDKIDPDLDLVEYRGRRVFPKKQTYRYIMVNKPRGYLTSVTDPHERKCVTELISDFDGGRVYPVGRLDMVSEGLLLMTNDGELANRLTHPSHSLPKVYRVKVAGKVSDEQYEILTSPMVIDDYTIKPVKVLIGTTDESGTVLKFTLKEGRNRQIRKMCQQVGLTVKRLSRISIGDLKLNGLSVGKWRELTEEEIRYLVKSTGLRR
jgi:23S rRNA pseudouridine2605 synthase